MKIITAFLHLLPLLSFTLSTQAATWILDNNNAHAADFRTLKEAHDAAANGDTIYVMGSSITYSSPDRITKELNIIGPGYLHGSNYPHAAAQLPATFVSLYFSQAGANGSSVSGVKATYIIADTVSNFLVRRCQVNEIRTPSCGSPIIIQNFADYITDAGSPSSNSIIRGNICQAIDFSSASSSATISHNIIKARVDQGSYGIVRTSNSSIFNNIHLDPRPNRFIITNSSVHHNISVNTGPDAWPGSDNLEGVDPASLFIGDANSLIDGDFRLKSGSPALGFGTGGEDAGAYGGSEPYIPSGLPPVPFILEASAPVTATPGSGLQVSIKIQNEGN